MTDIPRTQLNARVMRSLKYIVIAIASFLAATIADLAFLFIIDQIHSWHYISERGLNSKSELSDDFGFGLDSIGLLIITATVFPVFLLTAFVLLKKLLHRWINK